MKNNCIIKMTNIETGEIDYATNQVSVAQAIGCTKQLVSQVLSQTEQMKHFKTAKGWKLEYVDLIKYLDSNMTKSNKQ